MPIDPKSLKPAPDWLSKAFEAEDGDWPRVRHLASLWSECKPHGPVIVDIRDYSGPAYVWKCGLLMPLWLGDSLLAPPSPAGIDDPRALARAIASFPLAVGVMASAHLAHHLEGHLPHAEHWWFRTIEGVEAIRQRVARAQIALGFDYVCPSEGDPLPPMDDRLLMAAPPGVSRRQLQVDDAEHLQVIADGPEQSKPGDDAGGS